MKPVVYLRYDGPELDCKERKLLEKIESYPAHAQKHLLPAKPQKLTCMLLGGHDYILIIIRRTHL